MAKLHFKYGAMNSGKSDTLIKTAFNYTERGLNAVIVKPKVDTKGDNRVMSRGGFQMTAHIVADDTLDLESVIMSYDDPAIVLVDEAQFLTPKQVSQLLVLTKQHDISVICYGLRSDFQTKLFPGSERLFELADNIEKLPTMCFCGSQAEFNTRKINGRYVFEGSQVAIEDDHEITYDSLCGRCYVREGGTI